MKIFFVLLFIITVGVYADMRILETGNQVRILGLGLKSQLRIVFGADVHLAKYDDRDAEYAENYRRMAQYQVENKAFEKLTAKASKADALIFGGDVLSFPTQANVDSVLSRMSKCPCPWYFINGNHDWHFEGLPGTESELRKQWSTTRLAPLYQGRDWRMSSVEIKGVNLILIDNGTAEILLEQLDFLKKELAKGKPSLLFVHIPLYVPGRGLGFACGHPDWNAAHDQNWEIEQRPRWPEDGHGKTTLEFCRTIWKSPNLLGILAGHTHERTTDFYEGKFQIVAPAGTSGDCIELSLQ